MCSDGFQLLREHKGKKSPLECKWCWDSESDLMSKWEMALVRVTSGTPLSEELVHRLWSDIDAAKASGKQNSLIQALLPSRGHREGRAFCCSFCERLQLELFPPGPEAASSTFLTSDSLFLFWYLFACHLQCCIWFLKNGPNCYLVRERLSFFICIIYFVVYLCELKKKSQIPCLFSCFWFMFLNVIW